MITADLFAIITGLLISGTAVPFLIGIGLWRRTAKTDPNWQNWIHTAVFAHFLVTGIYGGIRMLTTNEVTNMLIRRIFAFEAYFNFAAAAFFSLYTATQSN